MYALILIVNKDRAGSSWAVVEGRTDDEIYEKTSQLRKLKHVQLTELRRKQSEPIDATFAGFESDYVFPAGIYRTVRLKKVMCDDPEYIYHLRKHFKEKLHAEIADAIRFMDGGS